MTGYDKKLYQLYCLFLMSLNINEYIDTYKYSEEEFINTKEYDYLKTKYIDI